MTLEHLFRPLAIGGRELPCRIVSTSHQTTLVHDNLPTEDFVAYQAARAQGGVGLIVMEAVAIDPTGLLTSHTIGGYLDGTLEAYRALARAIQPHGAKLFVQLFHGGREVIASSPKPVVVSSSAMPSHRYHTEPRALRTDEVEDLIAAYARCAEVAPAAGLDGIEITAAHGYLGSSSSAATGTRATTASPSTGGSCSSRSRPCARPRPTSRSACASAPTRPPPRRSRRRSRGSSTTCTSRSATPRRSTAASTSSRRRRARAT